MSDKNPFENPFEKPIENTPAPYASPGQINHPESIPTGALVISIIALLLGLVGILGSCGGVVTVLASDMLAEMVPNEEGKAAMKELMGITFLPTVIQTIIGFAVSTLVIVASIGCLTRKTWGRGLMKIGMLGSILYSLASMGVTLWLTLTHAKTMACLLYTSPSPRDRTRSRMPSSA